ncbi:hypothetical protein ACVWZA_001217 [Sphingomonas sp. UYAg733]
MTVSSGSQAAVQELADTFGAVPTAINAFYAQGQTEGVNIAVFADSPAEGVNSVGTVTLSDHDLKLDPAELRLEIVAIYPSSAVSFPNAIADCAVATFRDGAPLQRGAVHPYVMTRYDLSQTMEHLMFTLPFSWKGGPKTLTLDDRTTAWLQAVPISEAERAYAEREGAAALEELLAQHKVDVTDLNRESAAFVRIA